MSIEPIALLERQQSTPEEQEEAAINVQRVYRGHASRKKHKHKKRRNSSRKSHSKRRSTSKRFHSTQLPGQLSDDEHAEVKTSYLEAKGNGSSRPSLSLATDPQQLLGQQRAPDDVPPTATAAEGAEGVEGDTPARNSISQGQAFPHFLAPERAETNDGVSLAKAQRYRELTCPHKRNRDGTYSEYNIWDFPLEKLQEFGLGNVLYFKSLQRLGILYIICTLLAIPTFIFATHSKSVEIDQNYFFETTFLGNFGSNTTTAIMNVPKEDIGVLVTSMDVITCLVVLAFCWVLKTHHATEDQAYRKKILTVDSYTVAVQHLPNKEFDRTKIAEFFSRWGDVVDVAIAYNDWPIVAKYEKRGALKLEAASARRRNNINKANELTSKVQKLDRDIQKLERETDIQSLIAFVTFVHQKDAARCLHAFPLGSFWRYCMPADLQYEGHKLIVEKAPEPSNILYENLHYTKKERHRRRIITIGITFVLVLLSATVTFLSQLYRKNIGKDDVTQNCDATYIYEKSEAIMFQDLGFKNVTACYCASLGKDVYQERTFCGDFLEAYIWSRFLIAFAAVVVVAINFTLQMLMKKITIFERHHSLSHAQTATVFKLFVSYFVNTGLLAILINADFGDFNLGLVMNGEFDDLTVDWYNVVGVSMTITMILNAFSSTMVPLGQIWLNQRKRKNVVVEDYSSQNKLNEAFAGPQFDLASRYATLLNVMFVTLFYAPGMPIMYPIGCFTFWLQYWIDKSALFRLYRLPPRYDSSLEGVFLSVLPWAVVLHLIMAIWFYTSPVTLSHTLDNDIVTNYVSYLSDSYDVVNIKNRINQWNAFPLFMVLFIYLAWRLVTGAVVRLLCSSIIKACKENDVIGYVNFPTYWDAKEKIRLESYHLSHQVAHQLAFIRTKSMKQLPVSNELMDNPNDDIERKLTKTVHSIYDHNGDDTFHDLHRQKTTDHKHEAYSHALAPPKPTTDGHHIVPVPCSTCYHVFHVVDQGFSQDYQCPHCGSRNRV